MSLGGMFVGLRRLFVALIVFALPVMLRRRTMRLCGALVMLGVFLQYFRSSAIWKPLALCEVNRSTSTFVVELLCNRRIPLPIDRSVCDTGPVR